MSDLHERLENQRIYIEQLREILRECADDLAAELDDRHAHRHKYGTLRYERDMAPVRRARELLGTPDERGRGAVERDS